VANPPLAASKSVGTMASPNLKYMGNLPVKSQEQTCQNSELPQLQQAEEIPNRRHCFDGWVVLQ
jgi:hypothetical protein